MIRRMVRSPEHGGASPTVGSGASGDAAYLQALDGFIAYISRVAGLSPETVRAYEGHLEAYGAWVARVGVDPLRPSVRELRRYLADFRAARYAPRTVAAHLSAIRSFFKWCELEGIVTASVVSTIQTPKIPQTLPKTIEGSQMDRLLAAPRPSPARRGSAMPACSSSSMPRAPASRSLPRSTLRASTALTVQSGSSAKGPRSAWCPSTGALSMPCGAMVAEGRGELLARAGRHENTAGRHALFISRRGNRMDAAALRYRFRRSPERRGSPRTSRPTRCATPSRPISSQAARTCGACRSFLATRVFPPRSSTPNSRALRSKLRFTRLIRVGRAYAVGALGTAPARGCGSRDETVATQILTLE